MELLSPAGNLEKLKYAIYYGADAVYAGSQDFSLRAKADNFSHEDLIVATEFCHEHGKKLYVPLNIYAHNRHIEPISSYIRRLSDARVDAVIVSDIGICQTVSDIAPDLPIHISTQANTTSYRSVKAWQKLGAKRIILARELTSSEVSEIRERCPDIELEIFVHGAMCVSYSGRCLLSAYLNNRSANLGECTQPCRWEYSLIEKSRPGQYFPIEEDQHGFYFMNSKDLCLWNRLTEIKQIGIDSVKIEGRMKSLYYIANVTRAYRAGIDNSCSQRELWLSELDKFSHRIYTEGFFSEQNDMQNYETAQYTRDWQFVGHITRCDGDLALVKSHYKVTNDSTLELIFPDVNCDITIEKPELFDEEKNRIDFTKPNSYFYVKVSRGFPQYGIVRACLF
jgi:putative protease